MKSRVPPTGADQARKIAVGHSVRINDPHLADSQMHKLLDDVSAKPTCANNTHDKSTQKVLSFVPEGTDLPVVTLYLDFAAS